MKTTPAVVRQLFTFRHLAILLGVTYVFFLYRNAWVGDDAYITFRTVDNFINGYGLTWNIAERVQAYTNTLWMFVISAVYWFTREAFYTSIIVSIVISTATVYFLAFKTAKTHYAACLAVIALILSKAFMDYSTSGLENPLSHLLAVLFFLLFLNRPLSRKSIIQLSLIAALAGLNRMDCLLVYAPVFFYIVYKDLRWKNILYIALGFSPLLIWVLFSLFYYGFLFPNTAYAKLATCIHWADRIEQGLYYTWSSMTVDPITMIIILAGIIIPILTKQRRQTLIIIGPVLYILYVIWIGGSFISGRYFALPFLISIIVLSQYRFERIKKHWWVIGLAVLVIGLAGRLSPISTTAAYGQDSESCLMGRGIVDEKGWYFQTSSLLNIHDTEPMPCHEYAELGRQQQRVPVSARGTIGFYGYFVGPETYVIDYYGLTSPLMARLPCDGTQEWRPGHIAREIPNGFVNSVKLRENHIQDRHLATYYNKLVFITSGELFSWSRIETIVNFNLGAYDSFLEEYLQNQK